MLNKMEDNMNKTCEKIDKLSRELESKKLDGFSRTEKYNI